MAPGWKICIVPYGTKTIKAVVKGYKYDAYCVWLDVDAAEEKIKLKGQDWNCAVNIYFHYFILNKVFYMYSLINI